MEIFYKNLKNDGSLFTLKWVFLFIILFAIGGGAFGVIKVSLLEQSPSGRYAVYQECDSENATPDEPCDLFNTEVSTLGHRQTDQAKFYALIFGAGPGLLVGMIYGQEKWKKRRQG